MADITTDTLAAMILELRAEMLNRLRDIEDRLEMVQGSVIRLDGKGVEAVALMRMLERHDRRIKVLEDRTSQ
jgi:hypothetical protein